LDKAVFIFSADDSSAPLLCSYDDNATADSATFKFATKEGVNEYHLYYMGFSTCEYAGGTCRTAAKVTYLAANTNGSCTRTTPAPSHNIAAITTIHPPRQAAASYQPRNEFESLEPMEMPMHEALFWFRAGFCTRGSHWFPRLLA
jgi:hypothetical protein